jgi:hypothetical protein
VKFLSLTQWDELFVEQLWITVGAVAMGFRLFVNVALVIVGAVHMACGTG